MTCLLSTAIYHLCLFQITQYIDVTWPSSQIAKFMGPTWGPPGSCRPQMGPMLVPWTLLSGMASHITSNWPFVKPFFFFSGRYPKTHQRQRYRTGGFPSQRVKNAKTACMSLRHHGLSLDFMYHYFLYIRGEPWTLLLADNFCMWSPLLLDVKGIVIIDVNVAFLDVIYHLVRLIK